MTPLLVAAIAAGGLWLVYKQKQWTIRRNCSRSKHEWTYSGEMSSSPKYRRCVNCDVHMERPGYLTPNEAMPLRTWTTDEGSETEHDVRMIGDWLGSQPIGYEVARWRARA